MSKDRKENMDLEISVCMAEIQKCLNRVLTDEEQWIVRVAFLNGDTYGLAEAQQIVKDH